MKSYQRDQSNKVLLYSHCLFHERYSHDLIYFFCYVLFLCLFEIQENQKKKKKETLQISKFNNRRKKKTLIITLLNKNHNQHQRKLEL